MEYQKIINLWTIHQINYPHLEPKNCDEINDDVRKTYNTNSQIKSKLLY